MKKAAYRAGRIQVQGTLKIDVFSHVKYRESLAIKRFWAVLWRHATFSRLLAQPLCWNDKTRSFRNASATSEIHFFYAKSAIKRQDAARKLIFAPVLEICVFAQCGWNPNYFFAKVRLESRCRSQWTLVVQRRTAWCSVAQRRSGLGRDLPTAPESWWWYVYQRQAPSNYVLQCIFLIFDIRYHLISYSSYTMYWIVNIMNYITHYCLD